MARTRKYYNNIYSTKRGIIGYLHNVGNEFGEETSSEFYRLLRSPFNVLQLSSALDKNREFNSVSGKKVPTAGGNSQLRNGARLLPLIDERRVMGRARRELLSNG